MPAAVPPASDAAEPSSLLSIVDRTAYDRLINSIAEELPEATGQKFRDEAKECTDYARARRLIELVLAQSQVIMARPSEKDIEGSYQVLISLLERLTDAADLPVMVAAILKDLRASSEDKPGLRLKLLCNFYNLLKSGSPERFSVLLALIEYARDTKQLDVLADFFAQLDEWKQSWGGQLTAAHERQLYLLVAETLEAAGGPKKASEAHRFLLKYLATFTDQDLDAATSQLAVKGVIGAIKEPLATLTQVSTLLALPAVKRLEGDAAHGAVYKLLQVFSFGKLADLLAYEQAHAGVLTQHGIDREKAVRDMRLLSLSLLASEYEEIPYAEVGATLQVPQGEVEAWVVEAITAGLVEARMDQQQEVVMVTRATHRHFTPKDWAKLQEKLHLWRGNVQGLLATLRARKAGASN